MPEWFIGLMEDDGIGLCDARTNMCVPMSDYSPEAVALIERGGGLEAAPDAVINEAWTFLDDTALAEAGQLLEGGETPAPEPAAPSTDAGLGQPGGDDFTQAVERSSGVGLFFDTPESVSRVPQAQVRQMSGDGIPERPASWTQGRPWPPTTFQKKTVPQFTDPKTGDVQTTTTIDEEVIDWDAIDKALQADQQTTNEFDSIEAALARAQQMGLENPKLGLSANGRITIAGFDPMEGELHKSFNDAQANAPPGFRPVQRANGFWGYERESSAADAPGSWDDLIIQAFQKEGPAKAMEIDRFRDQVESNALSIQDSISIALQVAGSDPKAFMDIVRLTQSAFGAGTPQGDAFTEAATRTARAIDPFAPAMGQEARPEILRTTQAPSGRTVDLQQPIAVGSPQEAGRRAFEEALAEGVDEQEAVKRSFDAFDEAVAGSWFTQQALETFDPVQRSALERGVAGPNTQRAARVRSGTEGQLASDRREAAQRVTDPFVLTPEEQAAIDFVEQPGRQTFARGTPEAAAFSSGRRKQRKRRQGSAQEDAAMEIFETAQRVRRDEELDEQARRGPARVRFA